MNMQLSLLVQVGRALMETYDGQASEPSFLWMETGLRLELILLAIRCLMSEVPVSIPRRKLDSFHNMDILSPLIYFLCCGQGLTLSIMLKVSLI
jgi:hypothetical protein